MAIQRRDLLLGVLLGVLLMGAFYFVEIRFLRKPGRCFWPNYIKLSYAQQGEDLILQSIFGVLRIKQPTYLDLGANDPVISNNTYIFYRAGSRGVLVEPNPTLAKRLRAVRPKDTILNIGVGISDQKQADYYILNEYEQSNTFSKEQAQRYVRLYGASIIKKVIKMPLVNINKIIETHLKRAPDLISIDIEGLDLAVMKTLDFKRFRPKVVCIETLIVGSKRLDSTIIEFMHSKGYVIRGATFVNTIFVDKYLLPKARRSVPTSSPSTPRK